MTHVYTAFTPSLKGSLKCICGSFTKKILTLFLEYNGSYLLDSHVADREDLHPHGINNLEAKKL